MLKTNRFLLMMALALAATSLQSTPPKVQPKPKTVIPKIAQILGVRVGFNGQKALERVFGQDERWVGGHPNGQEGWRTKKPKGWIRCDGFSFCKEGEVIEDLEWSATTTDPEASGLPYVHRMPKNSGWMGVVDLQMTESQVLKAIGKRLPPPSKNKDGDVWTWAAKGYHVPSTPQLMDAYTLWTASLVFEKGKLVSIRIFS